MCEFLSINASDEQRRSLNSVYAKLILSRLANDIQKSDTGKAPLFAPAELLGILDDKKSQTEIIKDYNHIKDWSFPRCCTAFFGEKEILFSDFLEEIKLTKNDLVDEIKTTLFQISKNILKEENFLPEPLLESIQIGIDSVEIKQDIKFSEEKIYPVAGLASSLTRLFYLPPNKNIYYELDKTLFDYKYGYLNNYLVFFLLTLLSQQNVCPHFSRQTAFFTCIKPAVDKQCVLEKKDQPVQFHQLYEYPTRTLRDWLEQPDKDKENQKWQEFRIRRPLLLEIQNVLFQIIFTLYVLAVFNLNFSVEYSYGHYLQRFRIFICKKVEGYDRYRTLNQVFFVPNFGNLVTFHPTIQTGSVDSTINFQTDENLNEKISHFPAILEEMIFLVNSWDTSKEDEVSYPYSYEAENESGVVNAMDLQPITLFINQKENILKYLINFKTSIDSMEGIQSKYQFYQEILNQNFKSFQSLNNSSTGNMNDLNLINDFGFQYSNQNKLTIPSFIFDVLEKEESENSPDISKIIKVSDSETSWIVSPEIQSFATALDSLAGTGKRALLFNTMKKLLGEFLKSISWNEAVSDRYMINADQLVARKNLRKYGTSFLTLLGSLSSQSILDTGMETKLWGSALKLSEMLSNSTTYLGTLDPSVNVNLKKILKVENPKDLSAILTTLMLLTYLQRVEKDKLPTTEMTAIQLFAQIFDIDVSVLQEYLKWIEMKHGLPDDARYILRELNEKIKQSSSTKMQFSARHDLQSENNRQKKSFENVFATTTSESEQQLEESFSLQEEIEKTQQRLQELQIQIQS